VDEAALLDALITKRCWRGLDVFPAEPLRVTRYLRHFLMLCYAPTLGGITPEALTQATTRRTNVWSFFAAQPAAWTARTSVV